MDRNALDWLFSTVPQALAALEGLIFTGVVFILNSIDKKIEEDGTSQEIFETMKKDIHTKMKTLFRWAGLSILLDLVLLILNPIEDGFRFSFSGTFSFYLFFAGVVVGVNVITFVLSLKFVIDVASPDFFQKTVKKLSDKSGQGEVDVKDFIMAYIDMEKALRSLPIFEERQGEKPHSVSEMLKKLKYSRIMKAGDVDRMLYLTRIRNLIMHGAEISHIERDAYDDVKKYTKIIMDLKM